MKKNSYPAKSAVGICRGDFSEVKIMNPILKKLFGGYSRRELKRIQPLCNAVLELESKYKAMSDEELKAQTPALKQRLANGETPEGVLPDAFAVCREV